MNTQTLPSGLSGAVPLTHWGVIRARGADAVKFLQGQLTNDVALMPMSEARLAGFCSAKGRLQASFLLWKNAPDDVLLACAASVLPATLKRLSMFVMRAQCKLTDASAELTLVGRVGAVAPAFGAELAVWQKTDTDGTTLIRLPDAAGERRVLSIATRTDSLDDPSTLSLDDWRWLEVQSGVPTIELATVEQFVPQMLNYELVGGVDFKKGCYPGQEIVARSQYRGTIKRRTFLFDVDAAAAPGQEVFHSGDPGQPAGMIVNAAPRSGSSTFSALAEVKLAALESGTLHLGSSTGPVMARRELPYAVPVDSTESA